MGKLKNHQQLEQHCEKVYKDLTTNVVLGISVSLDSRVTPSLALYSQLILVHQPALRSELMLPQDCPYLQAITATMKTDTARKRKRERNEYDLTKVFFGCTTMLDKLFLSVGTSAQC